jgi:hypothetical protein
VQLRGDVGGREALAGGAQHVDLPVGQRAVVDHGQSRDVRVDPALALVQGVDDGGDVGRLGGLADETLDAELQRLAQHTRAGVPGQHEDHLVRLAAADLGHRSEAVDAGHLQVDDEHVGVVAQGLLDGLRAVLRLGQHGDLALEREQGRHRLTQQGFVVGQHHGGHR